MPPSVNSDEHNSFLTVKEAASMSSYSVSHLTRLARSGKIKSLQHEGRWLLEPMSFEKYLESRRTHHVRKRINVICQPIRRVADHAGYSSAWTLHQANFGTFNLKSLLESLAIAGCSVLVGLLIQASVSHNLSSSVLLGTSQDIATDIRQHVLDSLEETVSLTAAVYLTILAK